MEIMQCNRCKHKWYKRKPDRSKWCPKCKSPYWDKERVRRVIQPTK